MARAGRDISDAIQSFSQMFGAVGQQKLQNHLRARAGNLFLLPLKQRLFNFGISGDGTKLEPYSKGYADHRKKKGLRTRPTSLRYTGAWYGSMYVHFGLFTLRHVIEIKSRDDPAKTNYLKRKYGASILTLTTEEQQPVIGVVEAFILDKIDDNFFNITLK